MSRNELEERSGMHPRLKVDGGGGGDETAMLAMLSVDHRTYLCTLVLSEDQVAAAVRELLLLIPMVQRRSLLEQIAATTDLEISERVVVALTGRGGR
jgi:hypothetical protein